MKRILSAVAAAVLLAVSLTAASSCRLFKAVKTIATYDPHGGSSAASDTEPAATDARTEDTGVDVTDEVTEPAHELSYADIYLIYNRASNKSDGLSAKNCVISRNMTTKTTIAGQDIMSSSVSEDNMTVTEIGGDDAMYEFHRTGVSEANGKTSTSYLDVFIDRDNIVARNDPGAEFRSVSRNSEQAAAFNSVLAKDNVRFKTYKLEAFRGAKLEEDPDGTVRITLNPEEDVMNDMFGDLITGYYDYFESLGAKDLEIKSNSAEISITISPDGYLVLTEARLDFDMNMFYMGYDVVASTIGFTRSELRNPGESFTVTMPEIKTGPSEITGTGEADDALYTAYKNSVDKLNACPDIHGAEKYDMYITVHFPDYGTALDQSTITSMTTEMLAHDRFGENALIEVHVTETNVRNSETETARTDVFADKNKLYVRNDPSAGFTAVDRNSELAAQLNEKASAESTLTEAVAPEVFRGAVMTVAPDGSAIIKATPDYIVTSAFGDIFDLVTDSFTEIGATDIVMTINGAEVNVSINGDGYLVSCEMKMNLTVTMKASGQNVIVNYEIVMTSENTDPGKQVSITIPR